MIAHGPLVSLSLEVIGDDLNALLRSNGLSAWNSVWVAEITGTHPHYGFERRFLDARKDYAKANSVGSRGVFQHYALQRGRVYEIKSKRTWKGGHRGYMHVTAAGEKVEMTKEEVLAWLGRRSE